MSVKTVLTASVILALDSVANQYDSSKNQRIYQKPTLTKGQKKIRSKNKQQKKSRKINRKK